MKRFVALARVSSREQEREGFSLEIQEEALRRYAANAGGIIDKLYRIAETASKTDERKTFKELIAYAKQHAKELAGLLFYKIDRAARNLFDYVELERLEGEHGVPFISVSQPTDSNPAGRMMRRTLANMASFYTEQLSVDIREGLARRVQEGWFVGLCPYGYRNVRRNGRSIVELDPVAAANVRRMFQLYAYEPLTLTAVCEQLQAEGLAFRPASARFPTSSVHNILKDRAYIGELQYRGQWYPGKHEPLVDRRTWDRVQALLDGHACHAHQLTYAGGLIHCGHCGHAVTGENVRKANKSGECFYRYYRYYRCTHANRQGHPRWRVPERELDRQMLAVFDRIEIKDPAIREWFCEVLKAQTKGAQSESRAQRAELQRQETLLVAQQDRLLNLRIDDQIDQESFARKATELRDRLSNIKLQLDVLDRSHDETAELAIKVFELSQTLREKWLTGNNTARRRILEIVLLNCRLDGATLVPTIRKPFDVLAEGLVSEKSGGGGNRTRVP